MISNNWQLSHMPWTGFKPGTFGSDLHLQSVEVKRVTPYNAEATFV